MTPEQVVRLLEDGVLQAYAKREPLQYSEDGSAWWDYTYDAKSDVQFNGSSKWRKRPEPREWWVIEDGSKTPFRFYSREEANERWSNIYNNDSNYPIIHVKEVL